MTAWSPGALRFRGSWRRGGRRGRPAGVLGEEAEEIAVPSLEVVARGGVDAAAAASAAVGSESGFVAAAAAPGSVRINHATVCAWRASRVSRVCACESVSLLVERVCAFKLVSLLGFDLVQV
jgi:hypothetical protein